MWTDRKEYVSDQPVIFHLIIGDTQSPPKSIRKVSLEVRYESSNIVTYRSSFLVHVNTESKIAIHPGEPGTSNATLFLAGSNESASTLFKVIDLFQTPTAIMIYVSMSFLAALMLLIGFGIRNNTIDEILRFVFLSGIVGSTLAAFLFTDLQVGTRSPIGLVVKPSINDTSQITKSQWVLNIGGEPNTYTSGVQIPVYVLVLGLVGGYLRYLYKTSRVLTDDELISERRKMRESLEQEHIGNLARRIAFYQSLKDIVLLFLSPLVAVATWFLLSQWRPTENSVFLIGLVCFSASLVTVEIVNSIIRFTKGVLKSAEEGEQEGSSTEPNIPPEGNDAKQEGSSTEPNIPPEGNKE